jgi:hypothetical protein
LKVPSPVPLLDRRRMPSARGANQMYVDHDGKYDESEMGFVAKMVLMRVAHFSWQWYV